MNKIKLTPIILTLAVSPATTNSHKETNKKEAKGIAVLELFTSDGCSSCPPADELMGKLQNEFKDCPVYILAYHVDYWDHQGWVDIFGNKDFTNRQYNYTDLFETYSPAE